MSHDTQDIAERLERAADRMANAGRFDEERRYREAAATIRAGLSREEAEAIEQRLLLPQPRQGRRLSVLAAQGEYDTGGDGTGDQTGGDTGSESGGSIDETGAGDLLSTAFGSGLSDPFSPDAAGWSAASQDLEPFTGTAGGAADPFTALQSGDPYTQSFGQPDDANPYTTGVNVDASTGSQATESFTGGGASTDSPSQTAFSMAAFGYGAQSTSMLASPDLLAQNDAAGDPNVASDASSTGAVGQGSLEVAGQSWAWTNFVQIGDTTYNVFSSPDGTMSALQPSGGGPIVFVDADGNVTAAQTPSGGYVFPTLDIPSSPPGSPLPADFVPDPQDASSAATQSASQSQAAPPATPVPDPPVSAAPEPISDPTSTVSPSDASPQAAPSSSPPPSDPPDAPAITAGDPNQDLQTGPPGTGTAPGISEEQREEENWGAAKAGMWDALVNMADTGFMSSSLHAAGLPGLLDWAKSGPPAPTGNAARDAELLDNYESGGIVTTVVALAAPIGAEGLLASAEAAATKLPALEGAGMLGGGRLVGPTEQWLSAFGAEAPVLESEAGGALPSIADQIPTGPSFEGLIDPAEFENDPVIVDRLSRAQAFDIGGYESLTARGEYGRPWDFLDSDEALQNAYIRMEKGVDRVSGATADNPAMALPPELHSQIQNLRVPQMQGMTPEQVLQYHIDQMYDVAPDYAVRTLERESQRFIRETF